mmetsp:Transcript_91848/g.163479  ORF Transcript_91848/g.163479 Transcript_91848/m.163479 type:complete len:422 (-) Transcript_91848:120-1385(-)|eukprot:CAMPEP_0197622576 /NCGR_PEP_ID=MMETSP1338-20131121/2824_1 /TAXON_ID=43686 ORGANISM="Pelagodinium beii, Strain RCC1491" /NCGR_SAMPLE_ID=MMETSP1338 /ASSEMBLY_ACC=CAM_ASM_000754 /LENGTH=421 /DNA_ID=CAMNT_0043192317 /DNA_START=52 /DNA_END=1317 /DNA_ORIENTATION=+
MALSKLTNEGQSKMDLQDQVIDELLSDISYSTLRRGLRPWVELGLDAREAGEDLIQSLSCLVRSKGHHQRWRSSGGSSSSNSEPDSENDEASGESIPRGLPDRLAGVLEALVELGAELGLKPSQVKRLVLPAAITVFLCSGGGAAGFATAVGTGGSFKVFLGLGGLDISTKAVYAGAAVVFAVASYSFLDRHPELRDRTVQRTAAIAMAVGCLGYAGIIATGHMPLPKEVLDLVAQPDLIIRWLPDLINVPLVVINVGRIAGRGPSQMLSCVTTGVMSTLAAVGSAAAVVPLHQWGCLLASAGFMLTTVTVLGELPHEAGQISALNRRRALVSSDLLSFTWSCMPFVQALGLAGAITMSAELKMLTAIDVLMVLGTSHIVMRSNLALQSMAEHFEKEQRTERARRGEEPQREPPPRNNPAE